MEPREFKSRRSTVKEFIVGTAVVIGLLIVGYVVWWILNNYIAPGQSSTQRKDLVQAFAVIMGGFVAFGTLLIGWLNLQHN
jgi:hypothetical protein